MIYEQTAASTSLQKQKGTYNDISTNYGFSFDNRDRKLSNKGSILSFNQTIPIYADKFYSHPLIGSRYQTLNENVVELCYLFQQLMVWVLMTED